MNETAAGQAESGPSLRDALNSAYDASEAPESDTITTEASDGGSTAPAEPSAAGETGAAAPASDAPPNAAPAGSNAGVAGAKPATAPESPKTPPGFPGGDAAWAGLPAEVRNWAKDRERQVERYIRTNAEAAKFGGAMWQAVQPHQEVLRALGVQHPAQAVAAALNVQVALATGSQEQRAAIINAMAQHYGVEAGANQNTGDGQSYAAQVDPEVQRIGQTVSRLEQHIQLQAQQQAYAQHQMRQAAQQQVNHAVEQFSSDPQHPYMADDRVRELMASMVESRQCPANSIDELYDMACNAFPDIRAVLQEQGAARRAAVARNETLTAPARGGAPVAAVMNPSNESLRGTIERAFEASTSRRVA